MDSGNVLVLCLQEAVSLDLAASAEATCRNGFPLAEDAVEEMVVCLAAIEAAWTSGEFSRLASSLKTVIRLSKRTGLPDVAHVARAAEGLLDGFDDVALAAVIARLIRVGETSLATLLEISYRQI